MKTPLAPLLALVISLMSSCLSPRTNNSEIDARNQNGTDHGTQYFDKFDYDEARTKIERMSSRGRPVLIVSDLSRDSLGGVQRILSELEEFAKRKEIPFKWIERDQFEVKIDFPGYTQRLLKVNERDIERIYKESKPQAVHIVTEGALGRTAKSYFDKMKVPYTTAYHTNLTDVGKALHIPLFVTSAFVRFFHGKSAGVMSPSAKMTEILLSVGIKKEQIRYWTHGVDLKTFRPKKPDEMNRESQKILNRLRSQAAGKPIAGFVGRLSPERNIPMMMDLDLDILKVFVGDGIDREMLEKRKKSDPQRYKDVIFLGQAGGDALVDLYNMFDVFMFDASHDTFGLVQIEAAACGVPVAGLDGTVSDLIISEEMGATAPTLEEAIPQALNKNREKVREAVNIYDSAIPTILWFAYLQEIP